MSLRRATATVLVSIGVAAAAFEGCSASGPATTGGRGGTQGSGSGGSAATGAGGSSTGGSSTGGSTTGTGGSLPPITPGDRDATTDGRIAEDAACLSDLVSGEKRQTDLYFMMDNSGSMDMIDPPDTVSRWDALAQAIPAFVNDPTNAGMKVGLDFFPEGTGNMVSCNVADYTMTNVPVDFLPGMNGMHANAIIAAVQGRARGGGTPTVPALTGALQAAKTWQLANLGRALSVLFLTDGEPQGCGGGNNVQAAAAVAQMYSAGKPPINTYVLGVGPNTGNLDSIAAAGGTKAAYMVTMGGATALQKALADIRKSTLSCDYNIPRVDGGLADSSKINVKVRVGATGMVKQLGNVGDLAGCTNNPVHNPQMEGWFYDNPAAPTKITLCPASCGPLQVEVGSEISVLLGCKTIPIPPPR